MPCFGHLGKKKQYVCSKAPRVNSFDANANENYQRYKLDALQIGYLDFFPILAL